MDIAKSCSKLSQAILEEIIVFEPTGIRIEGRWDKNAEQIETNCGVHQHAIRLIGALYIIVYYIFRVATWIPKGELFFTFGCSPALAVLLCFLNTLLIY